MSFLLSQWFVMSCGIYGMRYAAAIWCADTTVSAGGTDRVIGADNQAVNGEWLQEIDTSEMKNLCRSGVAVFVNVKLFNRGFTTKVGCCRCRPHFRGLV